LPDCFTLSIQGFAIIFLETVSKMYLFIEKSLDFLSGFEGNFTFSRKAAKSLRI